MSFEKYNVFLRTKSARNHNGALVALDRAWSCPASAPSAPRLIGWQRWPMRPPEGAQMIPGLLIGHPRHIEPLCTGVHGQPRAWPGDLLPGRVIFLSRADPQIAPGILASDPNEEGLTNLQKSAICGSGDPP